MSQLSRFFPKRALTLFAVLALAITAALSVGVAFASADSSDCHSGYWCAWNVTNYGNNVSGETMFEYDNNLGGTNNWYDPLWGDFFHSVLNRRASTVWFSHDTSAPPAIGTKDCMIPGGGRGNLANWYYGDGQFEDGNVNLIDLIYSATSC